jgi:hypothetical protein
MRGTPWSAQIPQGDPAVEFLLRELHRRRLACWKLEADAELGVDTIRALHYRALGRGPSISTIRKALDALGFDLVIKKRGDG